MGRVEESHSPGNAHTGRLGAAEVIAEPHSHFIGTTANAIAVACYRGFQDIVGAVEGDGNDGVRIHLEVGRTGP